jgi:hypothetical protein
MVVAVDALTRSLAIVGAVSGLIGTALALASYLRDRPQLTVKSGSGGTVLRFKPVGAPDDRPLGRVFVSNRGRQPVALVEVGLTTVPRISWARRTLAWGLFLLLFPVWILVVLTVNVLELVVRPIRHHQYRRAHRRRSRDEPIPPFNEWESRLPTKLDMRVRLLSYLGQVWLAPELETEPLLLAPGQAKIFLLPWPERSSKEGPIQEFVPIFAFATDSRGRTITDPHRASLAAR